MKTTIQSKSQRQASKVAGVAIITMTIAAGIANDVTVGNLIVENNAAETLNNLLASKTTFNIGILSWLIILISDVFAAWGLYIFFKSVNKNLSLMAAWFRLVYAAMLAVSIFNLIYVHLLIHQPGISSVDSPGKTGEEIMFYLNSFFKMFSVSLIVFSIHILFIGCLSLKSEYVPKILAIFLIIAFGGYAITNISNLIFPKYSDVMKIVEMIFFIPMLGEVALGIWLLVLGLRKRDIRKIHKQS